MNFLNWFINPVKNHFADFSGRATRQEYWMFLLIYILVSFIISIIEAFLNTSFLSLLFAVVLFIPVIALGARRLHDTGMSGWWQLVSLLPFLGALILIVLLARKSDLTDNRYGPSQQSVG